MKFYMHIILALLLCVCVAQANLAGDPSLETGGSWTFFGNANRETWSAHSGGWGGALYGWDAGANGGFWQNIAIGDIGTYTFSLFVLQEKDFDPTTFEMKLEGYGPDGTTKTETDIIADYLATPQDGLWHHMHVTGVLTNPLTAYVRPTLYAAWTGAGSGSKAVFFDDAEVIEGSYTGLPSIVNAGFEVGQHEAWRGSGWGASPEANWGRVGWAARSGTQGVHLAGWEPAETVTVNRVSQPLTMLSTGTYSFSMWMSREENFKMDAGALRIEFLDETGSTKLQDDAVTNFITPNDNTWREYYVVGTLTNPLVHQVRPVIEMSWERITNDVVGRAARIDDVRFWKAAHDGVSVRTNWAYHSGIGQNAMLEKVPGAGEQGPFLQVNYTTRSNTYFVITDVGSLAKYDGEEASVWMRTSWQRPDTAEWVETNVLMTHAGTAEIEDADPFHGLPVSGTKTVDVWKYEASHPRTAGGVLYSTNVVRVYYAPYILSSNSLFETGRQYLLLKDGAGTNNLDQTYGPVPYDRDYYVDVYKPPTWGVFTNGGFENPVGVSTFDDSGWFGLTGNMERSDWGQRSGDRALLFYGWNWNSSSLAFQDVATTGGVLSFSSGVKVEGGLTNMSQLSLRMEWFTTNDVLVQVDERSLLDIPRTFEWYGDAVVGSCLEPGLGYVRLSILGQFGPSDIDGRAVQFDDAQFQPVSSALQNGDFEAALEGSGWISSGFPGRDLWAAHSGTYGAYFPTWDPGHAALFQDVVTTGGTYEFSLYMQVQEGAQPTMLEIAMEWYDKDGVKVQENVQDILALNVPKSTVWNRFGVVGSCYAPDLSHVRFIVRSEYDDGTIEFNEAIIFDDISVVPVRTEMENGGFEIGNWTDIREWYGIPQYLVEIHEWAWHSGTNGVAFHGWETGLPGYEAMLMQPVVAQTGTYVFSVWIKRETEFLLTDAELRLEWYGGDYPNKVQADTVVAISPPAGGAWQHYAVTGTCTDVDVQFVVPVVHAEFSGNGPGADRAFMMDDAMLVYTNLDSEYTDGLPNWWWELYFPGEPGEWVAADDPDDDEYTNEEEFAADTDPTSPASKFSGVGSMTSAGVGVDWSTNSRTYFIMFKTNLMDAGPWMPYGVERPGDAGGAGIVLSVTNDVPQRFYRVGAKP